MPFRSRSLGGTSRKHENTWSFIAQNASSTQTVILAQGTQSADITDATATEVKSGARITHIFFEFHFSPEVVTSTKVIHWHIALQPFGTSTGVASLYQLVQRRFIIKRGMEMLVKDVGTVFKRVFVVKIPRKYQRLGISDQLVFKYICTSAETINACGIAIYRAQGD